MTTKEMERAAIEKIRKIADGLGENSYVATALEGFYELAEYNIENDFACTMRDRWESRCEAAEKRARELQGKIDGMEVEKRMQAEAMEVKAERIGLLERELEEKEARIRNEVEAGQHLQEEAEKHRQTEAALRAVIAEKEAEIMKLKAKLYDLIVKD